MVFNPTTMNITSNHAASRLAAYAPLPVRIAVGAHLIHGTQDNLLSWARMLEFRDFLASEGFPVPLVCAVTSVVAQFLAGLAYLAGWQVRCFAGIMLFNFAVALIAAHWGHPYQAWFPAWMMWMSSLALLLSGAGAWSLDARAAARRLTSSTTA